MQGANDVGTLTHTDTGTRPAAPRSRWVWPLVAGIAVAALALGERRRRLRRTCRDPSAGRVPRNLALAGVTTLVVQAAERPVTGPLSRAIASRRVGLSYALQRVLGLSDTARDATAVVLMDYTLYAWHVLTHRVPLLYRFHRVHHADLDMDTTTALRFHFGEFLMSVPFRAAQIAVVGVSPRALATWQRATGLAVIFHHSNLRLPIGLERWLSHVLVTPRLHGIHHSIVFEEQDANWSSGLALWDTLHGTRRANVPQDLVELGVPDKREPRALTAVPLLKMPFEPSPAEWLLPDGRSPVAARADGPLRRLTE